MRWRETAQCATSRSVLIIQYYQGDEIKKNEMGRACGTYGGEKRFMWSSRNEIWLDQTLAQRKVILKRILNK